MDQYKACLKHSSEDTVWDKNIFICTVIYFEVKSSTGRVTKAIRHLQD